MLALAIYTVTQYLSEFSFFCLDVQLQWTGDLTLCSGLEQFDVLAAASHPEFDQRQKWLPC